MKGATNHIFEAIMYSNLQGQVEVTLKNNRLQTRKWYNTERNFDSVELRGCSSQCCYQLSLLLRNFSRSPSTTNHVPSSKYGLAEITDFYVILDVNALERNNICIQSLLKRFFILKQISFINSSHECLYCCNVIKSK